MPQEPHIVVIGAGIVGLATARALADHAAAAAVTVVEKEAAPARHQSSHNSGVLHAGVYYPPGSSKAILCRRGREAMTAFCRDHDIPVDICGKVIVATSVEELGPLETLAARATANGSDAHLIDRAGLHSREPSADGLAALVVPETAVVDFAAVCTALTEDLRRRGSTIDLNWPVADITEDAGGLTITSTNGSTRHATHMVNCAGLHADRVARMAGVDNGVRILPFRGEYYELVANRRSLVRGLVYPVPDPRFPFLGIHFTRGIDGSVHVGPNAVLALGREAYSWGQSDAADAAELARDVGVWRLGLRHGRREADELVRSASRRAFARAARRLIPDVRPSDLVRAGSGVRAQAARPDGTLLDDFEFARTPRSVHVLNAPSPAATASLAIGEEIARRLLGDQAKKPRD